MKSLYVFLASVACLFSSCAASKHLDMSNNWHSVAKMEDSQIYVDTASIKKQGTMILAKEKKVFTTAYSKNQYVAKIKDQYTKLGKADKANKWGDFSYTIYNSEYDCLNSRFRILSIEDYDSAATRIAKTTPNRKEIKWLQVDKETVGDYTFFFVCDYID